MAVHTLDEDKDFSALKPSTPPEKTGLTYIPLYSPAQPRVPLSPKFSGSKTVAQDRQAVQYQQCSTPAGVANSSISCITPLSKSEPCLLDQLLYASVPLPYASSISKFLVVPECPTQI